MTKAYGFRQTDVPLQITHLSIEHGCENKAVSCDYVPSAAPTWGILCAGYSRDPADWRHTELND